MGLIFFPVIGLGPFAFGAGLGIAPTLLSLAMLLTYSLYGHGICRARSRAVAERN